MVKTVKTGTITQNVSPERRFYSRTKAFGRFGMRIFRPVSMDQPHWHGHVEINFIRGGSMTYLIDGDRVQVQNSQPVMFWAGIPHQLIDVQPSSEVPELANIYLPLDVFLFMPGIHQLQVETINGAMTEISPQIMPWPNMAQWYQDYRSGSPERHDLVKADLANLLRRVALDGLRFKRPPWREKSQPNSLASAHIRHVVAMIRYILENIESPMKNADIAKVTGLHTNYALSLFSRFMHVPLKQFVFRMRLLRARGLLLESDLAISTVAEQSGFRSTSQFYAQFTSAYGTSPNIMRRTYGATVPDFVPG